MTVVVRPAQPTDRVRVEGWLSAAGHQWPPGRGFVALSSDGSVAAFSRLAEPPPGDGHHREHVRSLLGAGERDALEACLAAAAQDWDGRVEASAPQGAAGLRRGFERAGLEREVLLTRGWRDGGTLVDLELWGRSPAGAGRGSRRPPASASLGTWPADSALEARGGQRQDDGMRLLWHDASTREPLSRFLNTLVPGRSYPPGTLLSEAERLETSRRGALAAAWLLALSADGQVAGGLVLDAEPEGERAHVRRVHLDIAEAWRGLGIATRLLRLARETARERLGVLVLESDPRAGNLGACGALASAGFEPAGIQRGAWRLRVGGQRWDEDVHLFRCDV